MSKGVQIGVGATVIALLLGWYGATNLDAGATFTYYQNLQDFLVEARHGDHARVHGYVAQNSIRRDVASKRVHFTVQNDPPHAGGAMGAPLEVVLASLETPDLFKDGAEVVVEGQLTRAGSDHLFEADKVMAKCPSKFEAEAAQTATF
jgi:cytochrome c-type biogenesis protein CcmE